MTTVLAPLQNGGLEQPGLDPRVLQCGFARLLGKDVDYIVRKYEIVLGRRSKASTLDVILGDFMSVSRQHARILYSFPSARWELQVLGKNGVAVDGVTYLPGGDPVPLASRALLQIGQDVSFHFLLPSSTRRRSLTPSAPHATAPAAPAEEGPGSAPAPPAPAAAAAAAQPAPASDQSSTQAHTQDLGPAGAPPAVPPASTPMEEERPHVPSASPAAWFSGEQGPAQGTASPRAQAPHPQPSPAAREAAEWGHASVAAQQAQQAAPQQPGPQALLAALSGHPGVQQALASNPGILQALLGNPALLQALLGNPGILQALLGNPGLLQALLSNPGLLQQGGGATPGVLQGLLAMAGQQAQQLSAQQAQQRAMQQAQQRAMQQRAAVQSLQGQALEQEQAGLTPAQHQQLLQAWQAQQYGNPHQYGR